MLTRKDIEMRMRVVQQAHDQHIANANAARGSLQECQHWLSVLAEREREAAEKEVVDDPA